MGWLFYWWVARFMSACTHQNDQTLIKNMKNKKIIKPKQALIILNAVLILILGIVTLGPSARGQTARSRGQYLMVGGKYVLNQAGVAYILDQSNQELISLSWNDGSRNLSGFGYRNIAKEIEQVQKSR